jgi:hypothetical protein
MTKPMGQCDVCIYRYQNMGGAKCEAYPEGIPDTLYYWDVSHIQPYKGDNGIQFKQDPQQPILEQ